MVYKKSKNYPKLTIEASLKVINFILFSIFSTPLIKSNVLKINLINFISFISNSLF